MAQISASCASTTCGCRAENLLGEPGGGFKLAMQVLNSGRIGLSAGAAGGIKSCLEQSVRFATEREQFGRPIAEYELIEDKIARMAADAYAAESVAYFTAGLATRDDVDYALGAAAAKVDVGRTRTRGGRAGADCRRARVREGLSLRAGVPGRADHPHL